jgi:hypothetical protein
MQEKVKSAFVLTVTVLVTVYLLRHLPIVGPLTETAING